MTLEQSITAALEAGDIDEACTIAVKGYGPQILGYLRAVVRDTEDAGEVFSQFAEDLWRGLRGFRGESSVRVWAYKLAWHAASRFARDPYRRRAEPLPSTLASRLAASLLTTSQPALDQRSAEVERLRRHLGPEEQTLLILRIDRQLSWREVAQVMADDGNPVDEATLRKRYERLKAKLARLAKEEGLIGG
jgi:RNA polymerase sigma-70 factor (ECF subfamily)